MNTFHVSLSFLTLLMTQRVLVGFHDNSCRSTNIDKKKHIHKSPVEPAMLFVLIVLLTAVRGNNNNSKVNTDV